MAEPLLASTTTGWIEAIVGSMYSGKTEELIRRLRRAVIARQRVEIFKPKIDDRYSASHIVSHSESRIPSRAVNSAQEVLKYAHEAQVIGIDEGQFLGPQLVPVCEELARRGKRVIVAGLDQDYRGRPFEPMPELLAIAEYITKTLAICMVCGGPANRTYRKKRRTGRVVVGGADLYEARCRRCYDLGRRVTAPEPISLNGGSHASEKRKRRPKTARAKTGSRTRSSSSTGSRRRVRKSR